MRRQKGRGRGTRGIPGTIVAQHQGLGGLRPDHRQERFGTGRGEAAREALSEPTPRKILDRPKDLVACALATGRHRRLGAPARPGRTHGAPRRKTGLSFKQAQSWATLGRPYKRWPLGLQPRQALGRVEMVRDKARLLKRNPPVMPPRTPIMTVR